MADLLTYTRRAWHCWGLWGLICDKIWLDYIHMRISLCQRGGKRVRCTGGRNSLIIRVGRIWMLRCWRGRTFTRYLPAKISSKPVLLRRLFVCGHGNENRTILLSLTTWLPVSACQCVPSSIYRMGTGSKCKSANCLQSQWYSRVYANDSSSSNSKYPQILN